ncbi:ComEA family DNA-binding protein [Marinobacter zhejiangensis]|uniref:Competence protein ComEA n=1 Tax=Marinobacter zhejiangensis TaxID=488535 RepID=A0A1I4SSX0_9GAMM|nr:ComEA family DNA-binding protein [Marinobacter zhejiangensis]SFM67511.1 competence protein ComEA [Marinobacter zhejiangensis]
MNRNPVLAALVLLLSLLAAPGYATEEPDTTTVISSAININTATAEQLTSLDGIGQSKAEAIIAYRDSHGPFQSPEDLANVRGIGERTVARNADRVTVE